MDSLLDTLTSSGQIKIGTDPKQRIQMGKPFPLVLEPAEETHASFVCLQEFMQKNHETVLKAASEYGAVLFSGFAVTTGEEWASILYKTSLKEMNYVGGAAVRRLIVGNESRMTNPQVLTTNESPPSEPIPFHHELAQTPNPPSHICFYCSVNDAAGGSTPLIRSDMVYEYLNNKYPEFTEKIEKLGVRYKKVAPEEDDPSSALGRSWKSMFHKQTREEAQVEMAKQGSSWEWLDNGDCRIISSVLPAIRVSSNGKKTFFNQIIAAYTGWIDKRNNPKKAVVFGDDTPMPDEILTDLATYMKENECAYRWTPGRFVIVDNTVTYHSREPFKGRRIVYAAIGNGVKPVPDTQTHLALTSGDKMPMLGCGLWKMPKDVCADIVYKHIEAGYRLFDSACDYGNEEQSGEGIQNAISSGLVKREELFIVSKLWNTFHQPEHVKPALLRTLKDMKLDYLDLYLIHFPISLKYVDPAVRYPPEWIHDPNAENPRMEPDHTVTYQQTWAAMEELVREGLVKNIGISNVGCVKIVDVLKYAKIKPAVLQVEMHPFLTQEKLLRFTQMHGIQVMAYSNFGNLSYVSIGLATAEQSCFDSKPISEACKKYNKTPAQIALRWAIQRGTVVIPKTVNPERMVQNSQIFDFSLTDQEIKAISALNKNERYNDPGKYTEPAFKTFYPIYE